MPDPIVLGGGFELPPSVVTKSVAGFGTKGSGKTNTGQRLFEQMHGIGAQCVALDPVGNWWSLRLSSGGKRRGLDIPVFGGDHGDIPIGPNGGKLMAQVVVERRISCVIDLMNFKPEPRRRFVEEFASELFHLKKRNRTPLHLFLEEARLFAPQQPKSKLDYDLTAAVEQIVRLGRNYGLGVTLLDQRPQSVNKEVSSQTEVLIVHQMIEKHGRKEIEDWVRSKKTEGGEAFDQLDSLKTGEALIWAPGLLKGVHRVHVSKKATYDASKTPELGDAGVAVGPLPLTAGDLSKLEDAMKEVVEEAIANDPTKLQLQVRQQKVQIEQLMGQNKALQQLASTPAAKPKEVPVIDPKEVKRIEQLVGQVEKMLTPIGDKMTEIGQHLSNIGLASMKAASLPDRSNAGDPFPIKYPPIVVPDKPARRTPSLDDVVKPRGTAHRPGSGKPERPAPARPVVDDASYNGELTGPEVRILTSLAWLESIGVSPAGNVLVAFLSKYSIKTSSYNNAKGALRTKGLIDYPTKGDLVLTPAGRAVAPTPKQALTAAELHARCYEQLPGPERKILKVLIGVYPDQMSNEDLAAETEYSTGTSSYNNAKGRLRSLGLITYPSKGTARAADLLFIGG